VPIFDQSYRAYTGTRTGRASRILAIAMAGLRRGVRGRWFTVLMLAWAAGFLVDFFRLYVAGYADYARGMGVPTRLPGGESLLPESVDAAFFFDFLMRQRFFLTIATIMVGGPLIAEDLRAGAIPLYLSRPIGRIDYILGKIFPVAAVGGLLTAVPVAALWILLATKAVGGGQTPPIAAGLGAVLLAGVMVAGYGLLVLAISAISKSGRGAGIAFIGFYVVSWSFAGLLHRFVETPWAGGAGSGTGAWARLVSFPDLYAGAGCALLGLPPDAETPVPWASLVVLTGLCLLSVMVLGLRVSARSRA
jgi:ABC-2 type transport system permease protein